MSRCSVSGEIPVNPDDAPVPNSETRADGQHVDHWIMCPGEIISAGFKRPVRTKYQHVGPPPSKHPLRDLTPDETGHYATFGYVKYEAYPESESPVTGRYWTQAQLDAVSKGCRIITSMPEAIAETYAANPGYYGIGTFCCGCGKYFPVGPQGEFVWDGTNDRVGT